MGLRRLDVERPEMNLDELSLRMANPIALLRATQSPMGGADCVGHGIRQWHAIGVQARRLGCYLYKYIATGGQSGHTSTRAHAHKILRVQCPPFTACKLRILALCHTTTRVAHSRVLYCCLSYRVSLSVCTVCAAAPSPPSPSHCCTCLTTTVSHCRGTGSTVT